MLGGLTNYTMRNTPPTGLASAEPSDIDLDRLLRTLWRRRTLILGTLTAVVGAALVAVFQMLPQYTASALVMLNNRETRVIEAPDVVTGLPIDVPAVQSEVEVLRSRALAEAVADTEGLADDAEFNPALAPPSLWSRLAAWTGLADAGFTADGTAARELVIDAFREALRVEALNRSLVIAVRVTSRDPAKAARLAEATAGLYVERQVRAKLDATRDAAGWLAARVEDLRQAAVDAEAAVAAYRAEQGLGQGAEDSVAAEERKRLTAALAEATALRAEAEARRDRLRQALADDTLNAVTEVLDSPLIHRLREQEALVRREIADLSTRYGPRHPRMGEAEAELRGIRTQIAAEVERIARGIGDEARVAAAREAALQDGLARLERQRAQEGAASVHLRALEREAAASRTLYETLLRRYKEATEQIALQSPDARIVSHAAVPTEPAYPRKGMVGAAAAAIGLLLGLALVFVVERLDRGLRRPDDVERRLGRPLVGQVPLVRRGADSPSRAGEEEMRQIRTALTLSSERPPTVVGVTSSLPGEGKTTLCLWLARSAAASRRVVLVDADLRRPRLMALTGLSDGPALADVLAGEADLDTALRPGPVEGLQVLPGRPVGGVATDLLGDAAMRGVLETLRTRFDLVVVDTPPVLPVADARVLAPLFDAVLYAVRWEKTPDDVAAEGLARMEEADAPPPAVVLTQVDLRKQGSYGYGGYTRYYGRYAGYYAS